MSATTTSLQGKTCLVTGATSGLGAVTALTLAQQGATTIIVGRSREKGEAVVEQIRAQTGNSHATFLQADLSSLAEVGRLAEQVRRQFGQLDVLINNAGTIQIKRQETVDGFEMTFALNHLSPYLLTLMLLDRLKASAPSRIITISSQLHAGAKLDFSDLQHQRVYSGRVAYNRSKLANVLFTYALARRLEGSGVTANVVGLGLTRTGLYRRENVGLLMSLVGRVLSTFAPSAASAAAGVVALASAPELAGVTGTYFSGGKPTPSSPDSYDVELAEKLWRVSAALTGCDFSA